MRLWVVALLFLLPVVHAEPVQVGIHNDPGPAETTLYLHGEPGPFPMALNVQAPDPLWSLDDDGQTMTQSCIDPPHPVLGRGDAHTWLARVIAGSVRFEPGETPRFTPDAALGHGARIDPSQPARLVWYLESDLPLPQVVLHATVREGITVMTRDATGAGRLLAEGRTEPALLAGDATDHPQVRYVPVAKDGQTRHVYEFRLAVPYVVDAVDISPEAQFHLRVDAFVENPACEPGERFMPAALGLHSSDGRRPSLTWDVFDPVRIAYLVPQFHGDDLVVRAEAFSPWGRHDLGELTAGGMNLTIEGPATPTGLERFEPAWYLNTHGYGTESGRFVTWVWDLAADGAPDGRYVVRLTVENLQGTATSAAVATFEVGAGRAVGCHDLPDGPRCEPAEVPRNQQSPGPAPLAALGLLGLLAAVRRRS